MGQTILGQNEINADWEKFCKDVGGCPADEAAKTAMWGCFTGGYMLACERLGVTIELPGVKQ